VIQHVETYDVTTIRASTPMFLMSRKIKALGVKMVLSGEGSDEVFGGYLYFHKAPNRVGAMFLWRIGGRHEGMFSALNATLHTIQTKAYYQGIGLVEKRGREAAGAAWQNKTGQVAINACDVLKGAQLLRNQHTGGQTGRNRQLDFVVCILCKHFL
jgi:hypothetical protein